MESSDLSLWARNRISLKKEKYKQYQRTIEGFEKIQAHLEINQSKDSRQNIVSSFLKDMTDKNTLEFRMKFREEVCILFNKNFDYAISLLYEQAHKMSASNEKTIIANSYSLIHKMARGGMIVLCSFLFKFDVFILSLLKEVFLGLGILLFISASGAFIIGYIDDWSLDTQIVAYNIFWYNLLPVLVVVLLFLHPLTAFLVLVVIKMLMIIAEKEV